MKTRTRVTGLWLIAVPVVFMAAFTLLQINFDYPDILRMPAGDVLEKFAAGGSGLTANWYAMLFSAMAFIPLVVFLHPFLAREEAWFMTLATAFGLLAALVQMLGFARWPFLVPKLAAAYHDPGASEAAREAVRAVFAGFNHYAGAGIGEHLGYVFTSLWSLLVGAAMLKSPRFRPWLGWIGIVSAIGILAGALEPAGLPLAGPINAAAYIVWAVWLVLVGAFILRGPRPAGDGGLSGFNRPDDVLLPR